MKLSLICIKRPVLATVLSLALIIFGWIGYHHIETRYFPKVPQNFAEVDVSYSGASASLMEEQVTRVLENSLINIDGLTNIWSTSSAGNSAIYMSFADNVNMIKAMGDVRDYVSSVRDKLPANIDAPSISSGGIARAALVIGFMDNKLTSGQIRNYVNQVILPPIYNLPGMGAVWLSGASDYALRIWLNPQKMAALDVTVTDVQTTLTNNNIDFSGGSIKGVNRNYTFVANTLLKNVQDFANMVIRQDSDQVIRLKDVATVELGNQSLQVAPMRINQKNAITMQVSPLDSANPIVVAKESKKVLAQLRSKLPKGMTMKVIYDQSSYLKSAIHESFYTLIEAIALVMLVVFLFLGSIRAALVPIITIPVCVIAVFGIMLLLGFSINIMTLLAIILAIGLVVDDAIVVLENIHRHIEKKLSPIKAAIKGSQEIGFSVIAMTITLAAVYAPSGFASGFSATVFRQFAFTLAGAVLISGFVALTLSPMMCSKVLKPIAKENRLEHKINQIFTRLNHGYTKLLTQCLNRKLWLIAGLIGIGILGYLIYLTVPQSFIPKEDIGYFNVGVSSPPGSTIKYTNGYMRELEKIYQKIPSIDYYASFIASTGATNFVIMKPWQTRTQSTTAVMNELQPQFDKIPGIEASSSMPDPVDYSADSQGSEVQIKVMSLDSYQDLQKTTQKILNILKQYPGIHHVSNSLKFDNQVYQINFKRSQAALLNVNPQDIADTISILYAGRHITDILKGNSTYDVMVQMNLKDLGQFSSLNQIYVRAAPNATSALGPMVPLSNLVTITPAVRQNSLTHFNRMHSATLSAQLSPGYSLGDVIPHLEKVLSDNLNNRESYAFTGRIKAFIQSNGEMLGLFGLSILFIYLVLAAQFESFVDPFIILFTVPLCIVGALATLKVTGGSLNLFTNIGLITLVGLITKHGILITQFANVRLKDGESLRDAIINASVIRLRPILMTTCAMVLGSLPLALATGPGSVSHSQIGWIIVGGMIFGTFFSLIVVPVAYSLLAPFDHKKRIMINTFTANNSV